MTKRKIFLSVAMIMLIIDFFIGNLIPSTKEIKLLLIIIILLIGLYQGKE